MQNKKIQSLFQILLDCFGKDGAIVGLCGLKRKTEYIYITVPKDLKKTCIQNTKNNYLLL